MKNDQEYIEAIKMNVIQGRRNKEDEGLEDDLSGQPGVEELVEEALQRGVKVEDILTKSLNEGMEEVGKKYENFEYFIPDMLAAAEAVAAATKLMQPYLLKEGHQSKGTFILATVQKDQHDIGKNIVGTMLSGAGFKVVDLGVDVSAERIIEAVLQEEANFVGLSALLDVTMKYMDHTIEKLKEKNLRDKVTVFIGGAPTTPEFAEEIGADAYCKDAFTAVEKANSFTS